MYTFKETLPYKLFNSFLAIDLLFTYESELKRLSYENKRWASSLKKVLFRKKMSAFIYENDIKVVLC